MLCYKQNPQSIANIVPNNESRNERNQPSIVVSSWSKDNLEKEYDYPNNKEITQFHQQINHGSFMWNGILGKEK